jgi:phosphocarrier protein
VSRQVERRVTLVNVWGLHARTAVLFVKRARGYAAAVTVAADGETVDGKDVMALLTLGAGPGDELLLAADGDDAADAVAGLAALIADGFGEEKSRNNG